jgi:hypothetical protein
MIRVLASMQSLKRLWIRLSFPKDAIYDVEEKKYLLPFFMMKKMELFEISLPQLRDAETPWREEPPFKIIRRQGKVLK